MDGVSSVIIASIFRTKMPFVLKMHSLVEEMSRLNLVKKAQ